MAATHIRIGTITGCGRRLDQLIRDDVYWNGQHRLRAVEGTAGVTCAKCLDTIKAGAIPELPPVLPGDVVQITDREHASLGCFHIVEGVFGWGVALLSNTRASHSQYAVIGPAAIMPPEIASARRDAEKTAKEVSE